MTFPHDAAMFALTAVAFGDKLTVPDGEIILEINGSGLLPDHGTATVPIRHEDLEVLEERGWIEHHEDGSTTATEHGRYWVKRWWDARKPKRGVKGRPPLGRYWVGAI